MGKLHEATRPCAILVKPARSHTPRKAKPAAKPRCVVCGAELRGDHALGDLVCDCHPRDGYNPRCDPGLEERVLVLLYRAKGAPVNLYRALGCDPLSTNYNAIHDAVTRLNDSGVVRVLGVRGTGRYLAKAPLGGGRSIAL